MTELVPVREMELDGTWEAWRQAARSCLSEKIPPGSVVWLDPFERQGSLFSEPSGAGAASRRTADAVGATPSQASVSMVPPPRVPRAFMDLGEEVACHSDPARWDWLYRAVWRMSVEGERALLQDAADPLVARLARMRRAVARDVHKMRAFVRFRRTEGQDGEHWIAWFEPAHYVVERNARFFVDRFTSMRFSIFTPYRSLHWDGETCWFGEGARPEDARGGDGLDGLWRVYYASTYNPARTRWKAMTAEMPRRYWKNLPEARLIPHLVRRSGARVDGMLDIEAVAPEEERRRAKREARRRWPEREG